jgi:NAD(P)-dependent dehydrogenase (short-subunit alcohol dehydrogenase family)
MFRAMESVDVKGRTAVITGASRGLGAALALDFASRGMRLGLCARGAPALAPGEDVLSERVDVRDERAVDAFALAVERRFGAIDLWINNAGVLDPIVPLRDLALAEFREHIDVNLFGVFLGTRAYVRHLRARGGEGVLVNVSSGAAWHGYAGWTAYCAGKAAVDRLTECVALEEESNGLRAYAVAPGVIDTDMQARIRECSPDVFPELERFLEMKRNESFNTPAFVARHLLAIAFDPRRRPTEVTLRLPEEKRR